MNEHVTLISISIFLELTLIVVGIISFTAQGAFGVGYALPLAIISGLFLFVINIGRNYSKVINYYILIVVFGALLILANNGLDQGKAYLPIVFSSIGISLSLFRSIYINKNFHLFFSFLLVYGFIVYILLYFIVNGDVKEALEGSRNHISTTLLLSSSYYVVTRRCHNEEIKVIFPLLVFFTCMLAVGTSGILSSFIFLVGLFLTKTKLKQLIILFLILIVALHVELDFYLSKIDPEVLLKIIEKQEVGDIRFAIIDSYISKIDIYNIFFGTPLNELAWREYNPLHGKFMESDNVHNSYLLLHAKIGFLMFIVILGLLITLLRLMHHDFVVFSLLSAILLRGFTDTIIISHGYFDWGLLLIVLYAYHHKTLDYLKGRPISNNP